MSVWFPPRVPTYPPSPRVPMRGPYGLADILRDIIPDAVPSLTVGPSAGVSSDILRTIAAAQEDDVETPPALTPPPLASGADSAAGSALPAPSTAAQQSAAERLYQRMIQELGAEPTRPDTGLGPWEMVAIALPAIMGLATGRRTAGFGGSAAMLSGAATGMLGREEQYRDELQKYRGEKRAGFRSLLPIFLEEEQARGRIDLSRPAKDVLPGDILKDLPAHLHTMPASAVLQNRPDLAARYYGRRTETLGEYDQRFANGPFAGTPVPRTSDGDVDAAALEKFYRLHGIKTPAQETQESADAAARAAKEKRERLPAYQALLRTKLDQAVADATSTDPQRRQSGQSRLARLAPEFAAAQLDFEGERLRAEQRFVDRQRSIRSQEATIEQREASAARARRGPAGRGSTSPGPSAVDRRRREDAEAELAAAQEEKKFLLANAPPQTVRDATRFPPVNKPNPEFAAWRKRLADVDRRIRQARSRLAAMGGQSTQPSQQQAPDPLGIK